MNPLGFPNLSPLILKILELLNGFEKWTIFHVSDQKNKVVIRAGDAIIGRDSEIIRREISSWRRR